MKAFPVARRFAPPAIDNQILRFLRDFGVQVVHQHPHRGFLLPPLARDRCAARRAHRLVSSCLFCVQLRHRKASAGILSHPGTGFVAPRCAPPSRYARVESMATEYPALTKCFLDAVDQHANPRAQMYRTPSGWESISAGEMLRRVAGLSKSLAELGVKPGDRVGLFAPNCPEWHIADFAIQGLGAVNGPVYSD